MSIYALDSNIISYVLKEDELVINRYRQEARKGGEFVMPPIVYFEIKQRNDSFDNRSCLRNLSCICPAGGGGLCFEHD